MTFTTDPNDPRLHHGVDKEQVPVHEVYLILSQEERAKGFVRPYRDTYVHVGKHHAYPLRDLTTEEKEKYQNYDWVKYEQYPEGSKSIGRFWTEKELKSGCGVATVMGQALSETYAREPHFYGSTYCVGCKMHLPVDEFIWDDGQRVGS